MISESTSKIVETVKKYIPYFGDNNARKKEKERGEKPAKWPRMLPLVGLANDYTPIEEKKNEFVAEKKEYEMGVSIVIPVYNRKEILEKTLAGVCNQTYPKKLIEVIIADDGSSDGVEKIIPQWKKYLDIKYVRQEDEGFRVSAARNLGIKNAKYDKIIILDCDMLPVPETVEAYMNYLHVSSEAVLIGYRRFVSTDELTADEIRKKITLATDLPDIKTDNTIVTKAGETGPTIDWREKIYNETNQLKELDYPFRVYCGGNVAFCKSVLEKTGGFDEGFTAWGAEDTEMGLRVYNEGYYLIPVNRAVGLHQEPPGGENETDREGGREITYELLIEKCPAAHYRKYEKDKLYSVPKISIYMPAYNAEKYIERAVESALNQTYTDLEVVIVDDGSTDATVRILEEKYTDNPRVRWYKQKHSGIGKASNLAVKKCRGHLIGHLDSDDELTPDAIESLLPYFDDKEIGCVYGSYEVIDDDGKFVRKGWDVKEFDREKQLYGMMVHPFRIFRKRDWGRTDGFNEEIENAVDFDMYSKLSDVCKFKHVEKVNYRYRLNETSTSISKKEKQDRNTMRVVENNLIRNKLDNIWEPYIPDPEYSRRIAFRIKGDFGGWSISKTLYDKIIEMLEPNSRILEFGSGWGTGKLAEHFELYSVEHDERYINLHLSNYIHAPIINGKNEDFPKDIGWYDVEVLKKERPKKYDMILVDGPVGIIGRGGFYTNLDLFDTDVPIIIDDIHREVEMALLVALEKKLGKKAKRYDNRDWIGRNEKSFAIIE